MTVVQQPLSLSLPSMLTYDGWINHDGVAPVASALALWAVQGGEVWLRSHSVAGKSHLLQALAHELDNAMLLSVTLDEKCSATQLSALWIAQLQSSRWWIIDISAGTISNTMQLALFHLIERARREAIPMVVGWRCQDDTITTPELLSRLRAMTQLMMAPPTDDETLIAVLMAELTRMQWHLNGAVLRYLLAHTHRDLGALLQQLHWLHQHSLERQCKPSLINIRQLLEAAY